MDGIRGNIPLISTLLDTFSIVAIQEHWLYSFSIESFLLTHFPMSRHISVCVDDEGSIDPSLFPRGYKGISTLYNPSLFSHARALLKTQSVIITCFYKLKSPFCLVVNFYMPVAGSRTEDDTFCDTLDQASTVLSANVSVPVIILGDFNTHFFLPSLVLNY